MRAAPLLLPIHTAAALLLLLAPRVPVLARLGRALLRLKLGLLLIPSQPTLPIRSSNNVPAPASRSPSSRIARIVPPARLSRPLQTRPTPSIDRRYYGPLHEVSADLPRRSKTSREPVPHVNSRVGPPSELPTSQEADDARERRKKINRKTRRGVLPSGRRNAAHPPVLLRRGWC